MHVQLLNSETHRYPRFFVSLLTFCFFYSKKKNSIKFICIIYLKNLKSQELKNKTAKDYQWKKNGYIFSIK